MLIEVLLEEIKPVLKEKYKSEFRRKSKLSVILKLSDYQRFDAKIKRSDFETKSSFSGVKIWIKTLMGGIKPPVAAKGVFEYQEFQKLTVLFRTSGPSEFLCMQETNAIVFFCKEYSFTKIKQSIEILI